MRASTLTEGRVLFFIPTLEVGGAERVCLNYVNNFQAFQPVLLLQFKQGPLLAELKSDVPLLEISRPLLIGKPSQLDHFFPIIGKVRLVVKALFAKVAPINYCYSLLWQARRLVEIAHQNTSVAVISFITLPNIIAVLSKIFFDRRLKVIINVHDITSRILVHSKLKRYERFLLRWLIRLVYPRADVIVAVAEGIKRDLVVHFKIPAEKITVIYNPVDVQGIRSRAAEPVSHPWLNAKEGPLVVAVGRLVKLKGFDVLIRAFSQLPPTLNARLIIIGEGEECERLQELIEQLVLGERIALLGFQENPWKYMVRGDVFVLSSITEGLPNVIAEAMALGLPVLATDCSLGVRELLSDGHAGLLVRPGDPADLARGIQQLLTNEALRYELAERGRVRVTQFDLPVIVRKYEIMLEKLLLPLEHHLNNTL